MSLCVSAYQQVGVSAYQHVSLDCLSSSKEPQWTALRRLQHDIGKALGQPLDENSRQEY
jgi:hypothetical protein